MISRSAGSSVAAITLAAMATLGGLGYSSLAAGQFQSISAIDASYTSGSAAYGRNALVTVGDYQLATYYDASGFVKVGRRKKLVAGVWSGWTFRTTQFTSFNLSDGHNVSTIGVDGAGYLHLAWGVHNNRLQYTRSTTSVLNDSAFSFVDDTVGNNATTGVLGYEIPQSGNSVTYPEWFTAPGGDLIFTFRANGISGNGEYQMTRWNNATRSWSAVRAGSTNDSTPQSSPQPWIDNDYLGTQNPPDVSAYMNGVTFDATGRMHTAWGWRTGTNSTSGFTDYQSNHNIMYANSDNNGVDWKLMNGTLLRRGGFHDIDEDNATPVKLLPEGSSLINQGDMTVDLSNRPVIANWYAPNAASGNHLRQYMIDWYDGSQWRTSQVSNRLSENGNQRVSEVDLNNWAMTRPSVVVDTAGRVIVIYRDWQRGNVITAAYTEAANRDVWTTLDLSDEAPAGGEPTYDKGRWANDKVLSFSAKSATTNQLSVFEFDWGAYFAPQTGSFWNSATGGDWGGAGVWATNQPNGSTARANFGGGGTPLTAPAAVTVTGTKSVGAVVFNSQANGFTLSGGAGGVLALDNGGTAAQVRVMAGAHTIAVPVTMNAAGADFQNYTSDPLLITGPISGPGRLTKSGTGFVTVTGSASWTGGITINGGTLQFGNGGTVGLPPAVGSVTISEGSLAFNRSDSLTISNVFTGANGKVVQNGTGTLTFTGVNTFGTSAKGGLVVNSGTVRRGNASTFSSGILVMVNGGVLDMNGSMSMVKLGSDTDSTGVITDLSAGTGTTTLTVNSTVASDYYGRIANGQSKTLALVKSGTSSLNLRSPNSFSGNVSLQNGTLVASDDLALGTGTVTLTASATTELRLSDVNVSNRIIINGANPNPTRGVIRADVAAVTGSTLSGPIDINVDVPNAGGHFAGPVSTDSSVNLNMAGPITQGAGASGVIVKIGNMRFSGGGDVRALRLDSGLYTVGAANGIPTNAVVTLASAGASSLNLRGFNQTLAGLIEATGTNVATATNTSTTPSTLTINAATSSTYDGVLAGNLNFSKTGPATVTLTSSNSYSGFTVITGGALGISSDDNLGAVPAAATPGELVISGGTLLAQSTFTLAANRGVALGPVAASGTGTVDVASGQTLTIAGIVANNSGGQGGLIKVGAGTLRLSNPSNSYTGGVTVAGTGSTGVLEVTTVSNVGVPSAIGAGSASPSSITLSGFGNFRYVGSTLGTTDRGFTLTGSGYIQNNGSGLLSLTGPIAIPGAGSTLQLRGSSTIAAGGVISGAGAVLKNDAGLVILTNAGNSFAGNLTVNSGTLEVGSVADAGVSSAIGAGSTITFQGTTPTLRFAGVSPGSTNRLVNVVAAGTLSSAAGAGPLTLSGRVALGAGLTVSVAADGTVSMTGSLSGAGALTKTGAGAVLISVSSNTATGAVTVSGGRLVATTSLRPVVGGLTVTGGGSSATLSAGATPVVANGYTVLGEFLGVTVSAGGSVLVPTVSRSSSKASVLIAGALSLTGGGTIDLGNSDLIVRGGAAALPLLRSYLAGGSLLASGSQAGSANYVAFTTLSLMPNSSAGGSAIFDSYDGVGGLTAGDVIVKYTYVGDTNLDGTLDGRDLARVLEGYSLGLSGWEWGDVDQSGGAVTLGDVTAFMAAYNYYQSNPQISLGSGAGLGSGGNSGTVPEVSSVGGVGLALSLLARVRRRS